MSNWPQGARWEASITWHKKWCLGFGWISRNNFLSSKYSWIKMSAYAIWDKKVFWAQIRSTMSFSWRANCHTPSSWFCTLSPIKTGSNLKRFQFWIGRSDNLALSGLTAHGFVSASDPLYLNCWCACLRVRWEPFFLFYNVLQVQC